MFTPMRTILAGVMLMTGMPVAAAEAQGRFLVTLAPMQPPAPGMDWLALDKRFEGDLVATSRGVMISAGDPGAGSAGYVAMERVAGQLAGRSGSFALQHDGTMAGGGQQLSIRIVPGSGTAGLAGISGTMAIRIEAGTHFYSLRYDLPAPP